MLSQVIRRQFIDFFVKRGHTHLPSSPLFSPRDPTLLFTNAGMNQFKDLFLGAFPPSPRAVTIQKCIRAGGKHNDLENVGHTSRHLTFFEMLGNFSFGDYFKEEAIALSWQVAVELFGFDPERIWPTVFEEDEEAFCLWTRWVPPERITRLGARENFWAMGETGPCGPCSELLFDRGDSFSQASSPREDPDGERFLEFWNLVFMQQNRLADGQLLPLARPSIDTGAGLERVVSLKMGANDLFRTDIFQHLIGAIEKLSSKKYPNNLQEGAPFHVIADHLRSLAFALADGVQPGNSERGYVLRKILRRAARYGRKLGLETPFLAKLLPSLQDCMGQDYPELERQKGQIEETLTLEEESNLRTLERGGKLLQNICQKAKEGSRAILAEEAFRLKDTYGLPLEEIELLAHDEGLLLDQEGFLHLEQEAKELSRKASRKKRDSAALFEESSFSESLFVEKESLSTEVVALFRENEPVTVLNCNEEGLVALRATPFYVEKGGQIGDKGIIADTSLLEEPETLFRVCDLCQPNPNLTLHSGRLERGTLKIGQKIVASIDRERRRSIERSHTATHLLHWALCDLLGEHVQQKGSLVAEDLLRFDFSHQKAIRGEELQQIERFVVEKILSNLPVSIEQKLFSQIQGNRAIKQLFAEKYGNSVRLVTVGQSQELCAGTHATATGCLGSFKILGESGVAAGVRRIEALVGYKALCHHEELKMQLQRLAQHLRCPEESVEERIKALQFQYQGAVKELERLREKNMHALVQKLLEEKAEPLLIVSNRVGFEELPFLAQSFEKEERFDRVALLACYDLQRVQIRIVCSKKAEKAGFRANELIQKIAPLLQAKGGGRSDSAQAGGKNPEKIPEAFALLTELLAGNLFQERLF